MRRTPPPLEICAAPNLPERGLWPPRPPDANPARKPTSRKSRPSSSGFKKYSPPEAPRPATSAPKGAGGDAYALEHRRPRTMSGGPVPVGEGLDVDDHLLAHLGAALPRGLSPYAAAEPRSAGLSQAGVHRRGPSRTRRGPPPRSLRCAASASARSRRSPRRARCSRSPRPFFISFRRRAFIRWKVDGVCGQLTEITSMRAIIWSRLSPIGGLELGLGVGVEPPAVVANGPASRRACARRATACPIRPMPRMPNRRPPTRPPMKAVGAQPAQLPSCITAMPFGHAAQDAEDQRHDHVGGVVGHHAGRVGHEDPPLPRSGHVDMIHARPVIRDQLQPVARLCQHARVDPVGDAGHQNYRGDFIAR